LESDGSNEHNVVVECLTSVRPPLKHRLQIPFLDSID
jgi:hypothetical protein